MVDSNFGPGPVGPGFMHKGMREREEKEKGLYDTREVMEKYILVAVEEEGGEMDVEQSLDELSDLLWTAGGEEAGRVVQKRESPHPKTRLPFAWLLHDRILLLQDDGLLPEDSLSPTVLSRISFLYS